MKGISYKKTLEIVESIGMSIEDDLGFTVCGQLVNGKDAPDWIAKMNGWDIYEIAESVLKNRKGILK